MQAAGHVSETTSAWDNVKAAVHLVHGAMGMGDGNDAWRGRIRAKLENSSTNLPISPTCLLIIVKN